MSSSTIYADAMKYRCWLEAGTIWGVNVHVGDRSIDIEDFCSEITKTANEFVNGFDFSKFYGVNLNALSKRIELLTKLQQSAPHVFKNQPLLKTTATYALNQAIAKIQHVAKGFTPVLNVALLIQAINHQLDELDRTGAAITDDEKWAQKSKIYQAGRTLLPIDWEVSWAVYPWVLEDTKRRSLVNALFETEKRLFDRKYNYPREPIPRQSYVSVFSF
jgi:hypothetical protein